MRDGKDPTSPRARSKGRAAAPSQRSATGIAKMPVADAWELGDPYERYIGRWSRRIAPRFLSWMGVPADRRWLDVGCGTGALSEAILEHSQPAAVAGIEPSEGFLATAKQRLSGRVVLYQASAAALPLEGDSIDAAVSGLVLNFVPDQRAVLTEMARVVRRGGCIGAYVWDYAAKMEMLRFFWDAAVGVDPAAAALDEGVRFPLCQPDALAGLFQDAGLHDVDVTAIDIPTPFASFDDFWQPFLGGQGPAPAYVASLDAPARARLRERLQERLAIKQDQPFTLTARAWAVSATVA